MTLSDPAELKYDDGSEFYSPASFQRMIRSSETGKLYWIGNITADPPSGGTPRYPLVIAEVDESGATPSLKKNTVTVIDDKQPGQPDSIQFSNFTVFEDRETHAFDLYMTLVGENSGNLFTADNYKYVVTLTDPVPEPSSFVLLGAATAFLAAWAVVRRRRNTVECSAVRRASFPTRPPELDELENSSIRGRQRHAQRNAHVLPNDPHAMKTKPTAGAVVRPALLTLAAAAVVWSTGTLQRGPS